MFIRNPRYDKERTRAVQVFGGVCKIKRTAGVSGEYIFRVRGPPSQMKIMRFRKRVNRIISSKKEELTIFYTNAESLHNKIHELKFVINPLHYRPSIIAITEVKHKTIWQTKLSKFSINRYKMYHNDFEKSPRGIIVYVDCRLKSKQLFLNSKAVEHLILKYDPNMHVWY